MKRERLSEISSVFRIFGVEFRYGRDMDVVVYRCGI